MFRTFLTLGLLLAAVLPVAAQFDGPATVTPATPPESESTISPAPPAANSKKVWTNENLSGNSPGNSGVVNNKSSAKGSTTPHKPADPATIDRIKKSLQKCQDQLADTNLKLENFRKFQEGEDVSSAAVEVSKGYTRTPVAQQIPALLEKKKQLELQMDALYEEARKKEIEPGQLR